MNNEKIDDAVRRTRGAVEAAKSRNQPLLDFSELYMSWGDIQLEPDEKAELKQRLTEEGWKIENAVVLRF